EALLSVTLSRIAPRAGGIYTRFIYILRNCFRFGQGENHAGISESHWTRPGGAAAACQPADHRRPVPRAGRQYEHRPASRAGTHGRALRPQYYGRRLVCRAAGDAHLWHFDSRSAYCRWAYRRVYRLPDAVPAAAGARYAGG